MVKLFNQISLSDTFQECKDSYQNDKPKFLELLTNHLDLSSLIPQTFYCFYNKNLGRNRKYSLHSMLAALIFQKILDIPMLLLLIIFHTLSHEARQFYGLTDVPDDLKFLTHNSF